MHKAVKAQTIPQFELRLKSLQKRCGIAGSQAVIDIAVPARHRPTLKRVILKLHNKHSIT